MRVRVRGKDGEERGSMERSEEFTGTRNKEELSKVEAEESNIFRASYKHLLT